MNSNDLCESIIFSFRHDLIEEGYKLIIKFADYIDQLVETNIMSVSLKNSIQQHLITLQNLLDIFDDKGVAQLFEEEIRPLMMNIINVNCLQ